MEEEEVLDIWDGSQFRTKTFIVAISQLKQGRPVRQPRTLTEFNVSLCVCVCVCLCVHMYVYPLSDVCTCVSNVTQLSTRVPSW